MKIWYLFKIKIIIISLFISILNYISNKLKIFKGIAICAIAKNENLYINEFVTYYKKLGIQKIYLYDNNDIFGENFTLVLNDDIKSNFVEIINVRGKEEFQVKAYNDCYQKHLYDYSWFLIIDVDEYLYIKNNISLYTFLNDLKFKKCNNIHINHKMYGDSNLLYYDKRPLSQKFTQNYMYSNFMKTIVRGGIKNAQMHLHKSFEINNYCDSEGNKINPGPTYTYDLNVKNAEIRHYITKTIEEFKNRLLRGWPDMKYGSQRYNDFVDKRIVNFFTLNNITKKKIDIIYPLIKNKEFYNYLLAKLNGTAKIIDSAF
jgi:hypothetical protein